MLKKSLKKRSIRKWKGASRTLAVLALTAVFLGLLPGVVQADKSKGLVLLAGNSAGKREVVYAKLAATGDVEQIYVVNHFQASRKTQLIDYGDYESVTQLTGKTPPRLVGNKITVEDAEGHYYYQGNLKSRDLPWHFDIKYRLDGEEKSPESLSGASGRLEIDLGISRNGFIDSSFMDQYALQISIPIDPDRAVLLGASEGAVVSYAGSVHQLTYIVLPGSETVIEVLLDVDDFAMDQIVLAGVPLSFDLDLEDLESELDPLEELTDGISELNKGAERLNSGYKELLKGYQALITGSQQLAQGGTDLKAGGNQLQDGLGEYAAGVSQYAGGVKDLSQGYGQLDDGIRKLQGGAQELQAQGQALVAGSAAVLAGLDEILEDLTPGGDDGGLELPTEQLDGLLLMAEGVETGLAESKGAAAGLAGGLNAFVGILQESKLNFASAVNSLPGGAAEDWSTYLFYAGVQNEEEIMALTQLLGGYQALLNLLSEGHEELGLPKLSTLADGAQGLSEGLEELHTSYTTGSQDIPGLLAVLDALVDQLKDLAVASEAEIQAMMGELVGGFNEFKEKYSKFHEGLGTYVNEGVGSLAAGLSGTKGEPGLSGASSQVKEGLNELETGGAALSQAGSELGAGMKDLNQGLSEYLAGVSGLKEGLVRYRLDGLVPYRDGLGEYADGMAELGDQTSDLKEQFVEALKERLADFTGEDYEVRSFVSNLNKDVISVQFVMMAAEIPPVNGK